MCVTILDEVSAIVREKTTEMSRWGESKCPHFRNSESPYTSKYTSVIFLCVLLGGLSLVCYGRVSVQRESTVHLKYNLHLLFY